MGQRQRALLKAALVRELMGTQAIEYTDELNFGG